MTVPEAERQRQEPMESQEQMKHYLQEQDPPERLVVLEDRVVLQVGRQVLVEQLAQQRHVHHTNITKQFYYMTFLLTQLQQTGRDGNMVQLVALEAEAAVAAK
jgi:AraC-like DNA-binding protein